MAAVTVTLPAARTVRATQVVAAGTALVGLHLVVAATVEDGLLATLLPLAVAVAFAAAFSRLRRGFAAWAAFVVGTVALVDGGLHTAGGVAGVDDATGLLSGVGGLALVLVAARLALRPKAERRFVLRWGARLGALAGTAATVVFVVVPIAVGVYFVHKQPRPVSAARFAIPHRDVTLHASDGVELAAWYVPSRNGAAVVLVHGAGGDRAGGIESRALMLARHGYGVVLYDARGDGESGGRTESMGWTWHRDAAAAVDFLAARGIGRIGVLGLSTGAETALETAGRDARVRAVVAEGAQARSFAELGQMPHTADGISYRITFGSIVAVYRVLSLERQPPSLAVAVERTHAPLFLISSGSSVERDANRVWARHAGGRATLWEMPEAAHTGGLKAFPELYDARVTAFFDRALLR